MGALNERSAGFGPASMMAKAKTRAKKEKPAGMRPRGTLDRHVMVVTVLFIIGLMIRLQSAAICRAVPSYSDMAEYDNLAAEGTFNTHRPPLYPLFLRAIYALFGTGNYSAVFVIQSVLSSLAIVLMYRAVSRMWSRRAGVIAAAIYCVYPGLIMYNLTTLTESLSVLIAVAIIAVAASSLDDRRKAIMQALIVGIGALTKPAFLFFVPGMLLTMRRKLIFLVVFLAALAPWILYNAVVNHELVLVSDTGALNFYMSYNLEAKGTFLAIKDWESVPASEYFRMGLDFIRNNKLQTAEIIYGKIFTLFELGWVRCVECDLATNVNVQYAMMYGYLLVFAFGCIGLARRYRGRHLRAVLPILSYVALLILLSHFQIRFRALYEPLLMAYTAMLFGGRETDSPSTS